MANNKFGAKEVLDVTLYDMVTGDPVITFDTLKTSSISVTSEKVYARGGKGNPKLITWEINKDATMNIEDALLSPKSMELVSGIATKVGEQTISIRQKTEWDENGDKGDLYPLTVSEAGAVTLAYAPTGVDTIRAYLADDDCGTKIDMTDAQLAEKVLTFGADVLESVSGKKIIVYYDAKSPATAETFVITSDKFSSTYKLVGTTVVRNATTLKDEPFQIIIPNLKWSSNLELGFTAEGDPAAVSFECEVLRPADSNTLIQMIKY